MSSQKPANCGRGSAIAFLFALIGHEGDDCVLWTMSRNWNGYGQLGYLGRKDYAHRVMCRLAHGEPPTPKHQATHSCGRGHDGCVNPKHLSWRTNSENQLDRRLHGTRSDRRLRQLTVEDVAEIRVLKGSVGLFELAKRYGVKRGCIEFWLKDDHPPCRLKHRNVFSSEDCARDL